MSRRTTNEARRLHLQGELYNPLTHRFLVEAGIRDGMRVLDVGCGVGDVSRTLENLVGPSGSVTAIDCSSAILANARKQTDGAIEYLHVDAERTPFGVEFDAVVGRFVIRGFIDAVATLRHLASRVKNDGVIALQEKLLDVPARSYPSNEVVDQVWQWTDRTRRAARVDLVPGARLGALCIAAGLADPELRVDIPVGGGSGWPGYSYLAETLRGMLPLAERFGIVTAQAARVNGLAQRMAAVAAPQDFTLLAPCVGAWTRAAG